MPVFNDSIGFPLLPLMDFKLPNLGNLPSKSFIYNTRLVCKSLVQRLLSSHGLAFLSSFFHFELPFGRAFFGAGQDVRSLLRSPLRYFVVADSAVQFFTSLMLRLVVESLRKSPLSASQS